MKKTLRILFGILILSALRTEAQITITHNDLPTIGTQIIRAVDNVTQVDPGSPGLNQVWDFTNLIPLTHDTTLYLPVQGLPNYQAYPAANAAISHRNGNMMPYYDYEYIQYDDDGIRYAGDEDFLTIFGTFTMSVHISCNPTPLSLPLPFTYGQTLNQSTTYDWLLASHSDGALLDSIRQISHMDISLHGDASGIMSTPFGTFQVLRVKEDIISLDSVLNWENGWVFDRVETSTYTVYRWYTNDYYEVGELNLNSGKANGFSFFRSETIVNNTFTEKTMARIFPNPATDMLSVESAADYISYEIIDPEGRITDRGPYLTAISIAELTPGFYILRLKSDHGSSCIKFIKQ